MSCILNVIKYQILNVQITELFFFPSEIDAHTESEACNMFEKNCDNNRLLLCCITFSSKDSLGI